MTSISDAGFGQRENQPFNQRGQQNGAFQPGVKFLFNNTLSNVQNKLLLE